MTDPILKASGLSKRYRDAKGEVLALDSVDLDVAPGEFVAVCEPSGCGKSTLLMILGALLRPDDGALTLGAEDPYQLGPGPRAAFRAGNIGFVFQDFHLVPYLDVLDNVLAPTLAIGVENAAARANELLDALGLADRSTHVPSTLSAGEQQRTALARALLAKPRLVLADEPTGNLDRDNARQVLDHLARYANNGAAVVMVTHDESAMAATSRKVTMERGRIVSP